MVSNKKRISPREEQFIRFLDTVREAGNEPAIDELGETLGRLVPPMRAVSGDCTQDETDDLDSRTT